MDFFQIFFEKEKEKPSSLTQKNTQKKKGEVNHLKDSLDSGKLTVAMGNPPFWRCISY